jgi:beta-N-acetylhexosaminidase
MIARTTSRPAARRLNSASRTAIGQLFVIGFDGIEVSPALASMLSRVQPAGVILFARNIVNAQQTHQLLNECRHRVRERLFNCVDLEGGRVDRFRNVTGPAPSAAEVFATRERKLFRQHGEMIGRLCCTLGFNVDFAPVLDLAFEASQKVMSSRAVSDDPNEVIVYAREFLAGLTKAKVIGAGKHFPGLGEGNLDSHLDLPVIHKSFKKLWREDLVPYCQMRRELPMVLISHANYPEVTRDQSPASLSKKWITDVLRRRMDYRGLIVSDDLEMGGVLKAAPIDQAAVEFIRAGGDVALICHEQKNVEQAYETMVREWERDSRFRQRVAESARRVAVFKRKAAALKTRAASPTPEKIGRLSTQLWEFSERVRLSSLSVAAAAGGRQ